MISDKIKNAEVVWAYNRERYFPKRFKFSKEINFEFDSYSDTYADRYAHFILYSNLSREIIEIFEYTVVTELYCEGRTTEFDVMIRYKGELYFYMNEVLLLNLKKNTENFTII